VTFVFQKDSFLSAPPEAVFELHERPDAFRMLTPPSSSVDVVSTATTLRPSEEVVRFDARVLGLSFPFAMVHTVYRKPELFVDEQLRGFFDTWRHDHRFVRGGFRDDPATMLSDRIAYSHPLLYAGNFVVRRRLAGLFAFRHDATRGGLADVIRAGPRPDHVVVTGATGLIGRRLVEILVEKGSRVTALVRSPERARAILGEGVDAVRWDFSRPDEREWTSSLEGADAVVHLAGTPLFAHRWTPAFKREMEESRTLSTRGLVEAIAASRSKPKVLVTASAVGYYGTDPRRLADEKTDPADDLLARLCVAWEKEARAVEAEGIRSVQVRTGVVLSPRSGALKEMLLPFRLGAGGVLGAPDRWINWVHLEDVARILLMAILDEPMRGPVNAVSPHPVSNKTLAHTLARVLRRPCLLRYPEAVLKLLIGEAGAYTSGGARVLSDHVRARGYEFFFDDLETALRSLLGRPR
jgi:uncharacterized protein (TIGR01777 family)